ncbi:hypothetical protein GHT06_021747 [Daphnia sinensis]|uniref:Phosphatase and actin regulator n=1 Tax=Daphnia sinensis TaxID=1820382 RepID=A0AAD5PNU7_9CRUS|nr:hypothetical protein GHT06_021747 [Daphnia sinensis]
MAESEKVGNAFSCVSPGVESNAHNSETNSLDDENMTFQASNESLDSVGNAQLDTLSAPGGREVTKGKKMGRRSNQKKTGRHSHSNGTHVGGVGGVTGSGQTLPAPINSWNNLPLERSKSKFASLSRLFKPWKWRVRRKSDKLESVSQTLERKMSMRAHRDELIQKGILLPDLANATSPTNTSNTLSTIAETSRAKRGKSGGTHRSLCDSSLAELAALAN